MNFILKETILRSGLKQKYIAQRMNMTAVNFSKKLIGDLYFSEQEKNALAKILHEKVNLLFPNKDSRHEGRD